MLGPTLLKQYNLEYNCLLGPGIKTKQKTKNCTLLEKALYNILAIILGHHEKNSHAVPWRRRPQGLAAACKVWLILAYRAPKSVTKERHSLPGTLDQRQTTAVRWNYLLGTCGTLHNTLNGCGETRPVENKTPHQKTKLAHKQSGVKK